MDDGTIRLSDLAGKNIVNIYDGVKLGVIYEPNLSFDPETGRIEQLYLGGRNGFTGVWSEKNSLPIPWQAVHKIGQEVVIVDLGQSPMRYKRNLF
ncbi:MAG: YlmC/YmxH family sporulation protein [Peptococcaceae bacterium]